MIYLKKNIYIYFVFERLHDFFLIRRKGMRRNTNRCKQDRRGRVVREDRKEEGRRERRTKWE